MPRFCTKIPTAQELHELAEASQVSNIQEQLWYHSVNVVFSNHLFLSSALQQERLTAAHSSLLPCSSAAVSNPCYHSCSQIFMDTSAVSNGLLIAELQNSTFRADEHPENHGLLAAILGEKLSASIQGWQGCWQIILLL